MSLLPISLQYRSNNSIYRSKIDYPDILFLDYQVDEIYHTYHNDVDKWINDNKSKLFRYSIIESHALEGELKNVKIELVEKLNFPVALSNIISSYFANILTNNCTFCDKGNLTIKYICTKSKQCKACGYSMLHHIVVSSGYGRYHTSRRIEYYGSLSKTNEELYCPLGFCMCCRNKIPAYKWLVDIKFSIRELSYDVLRKFQDIYNNVNCKLCNICNPNNLPVPLYKCTIVDTIMPTFI